ncbi:TPA: hypothetical protein ACMDXH_000740 [Vibrio parahaemolyticus]|nr:hypothetical protein [Vibrio parahaemolyticus]EHY8553044.1 hypothetical protein [Vibrio parahaemolyticus]EIA9327223.1 hypothetical protein [Vibrio parahaemolyticus]
MTKKRIKVSVETRARPMRRKADHEEVFEDIRQGFRVCDIARKHKLTRDAVYKIKYKMQAIEQGVSHV